uniref:Ribosomal protein S10 n=1 Tax=Climaconeis cf. scalaris TaxID=2846828 RepID=A0A8F8SPY9_9STRA|nr:ribosomal protein S10 [Climaconeis cf. scalaris]QYB19346.1 ribosomal protein S10 [Climaconeis cf. scalaris]
MRIKTSEKIRIRLESFNHHLLTSSCQKIITILENIPLTSTGIITLPTSKRIYCVLRSPHVDKDSREHFEIRIHKRILEINYDLESPVVDLILGVNLSPGVYCHIRFPN